MARPCEYCLPFIQEVGIKKVHYRVYGSFKTEIL
jgi:deoxycytidylate deaminase